MSDLFGVAVYNSADLAQRLSAQHHFVPVLEKRARRAVRQLDRLSTRPGQFQQAPPLLALGPRDRPGPEQVADPQARSVRGQMSDLLGDRPVEMARVAA